MPVLDANDKAQSYTQLRIEKPYIAVHEETYISLHPQEFNTCKRIGYEHFCEELFVVKANINTVVPAWFISILEHELGKIVYVDFSFCCSNCRS